MNKIIESLEKLADLQDGWCDGEGLAPTKEFLEWFREKWLKYFPKDNHTWFVPTIEGGIFAEWGEERISLEIEPDKKAVCLSRFTEDFYNLANESDWEGLQIRLKEIL